MVRERDMRINSNTKIANRGSRGDSRERRVSGKVYCVTGEKKERVKRTQKGLLCTTPCQVSCGKV